MSLRRSRPIPFTPTSLSDALDSSNIFRGAMSALQNLIPDPSTKNLWQCRPAAATLTSFSGLTTPGFISATLVLGTRVYGMIASGLNAGNDQPFCYDTSTSAFIAISGITSANTPLSPQTSGAWTPPTMALVGTKIMVTHPGFTGSGGNYFGWIDVSDPASLSWSAGDLTTHAIGSVPVAVAQFNGRAYYIVNPATGQPGLYYSDALAPTVATNANQILTFGDNVPLTALGGLPLNNQLGGVVQSLMVFKGLRNIYQVTGDAATSNLAINALNVATGTLAQNTVCTTPKGLAFMSGDGLRMIDFDAHVSDPIGVGGMGITTPFIYAVTPSRAAAGCNSSVLRISVNNGYSASGSTSPGQQEYWYDLARQVWSGPHTCNSGLIQPFGASFVTTIVGANAKLFTSDVVQSSTSVFVENGTQMTHNWRTTLLPDTDQMQQNAMIETTLKLSLVLGSTLTVIAADQNDAVFDTVAIPGGTGTSIWGQAIWGVSVWQASIQNLYPIRVAWTQPIVFQRVYIAVSGQCVANYRIGDMHMRYEQLGYMLQPAVA